MSDIPHSNYEIRWKNFKGFEDTGWIVLKPLTILIGPNNSGKSSVLSPLLLLNQTFKSPDTRTPLITRGKLIDVGNYKNFVHLHKTGRDVFFGLRFHTHKPPADRKLAKTGKYPPGGIELTFTAGKTPQDVVLRRYQISDLFGRPMLRRDHRTTSYSLSGSVSTSRMTAMEKKAVLERQPTNFSFTPNATMAELSRIRRQKHKDTATKNKRFSEPFSLYLQSIGYTQDSLFRFFYTMAYLGPLRLRPERYYRIAAESAVSVGAEGQYAPHIFRAEPQMRKQIDRWIKRFNFGEELVSMPQGDALFELCFRTGKTHVNIADAGFGASQVLPLIIQAFSAAKDSLTLAEQPEIHLNPRLQSTLADLLVQMAISNHRVVVETHSEHLLVRLRTLVAERKINSKNVAIYFVCRKGDNSVIREIPIEQNGYISSKSWPSGFFDDALREALALATAQAKSRQAT